MPKKTKLRLVILERGLLIAGVLLLVIYAVARIHSAITFRAAVRDLKGAKPAGQPLSIPETASEVLPPDLSPSADQSLWSEERIRAYQRSTIKQKGTALALLRIPKIELEVPVLEGTDALTLNSGVGRIAGTALPGQRGNIGIAGHRDGFFRGLKDIHTGDAIELIVGQRTHTYIVDKIHITSPTDMSVLRPSPQSELTLVTCYPFYFVGPAPERFIVRASLRPRRSSP